jgi:hypothetical protein
VPSHPTSMTSREEVQAHRERMRHQGLRAMQIWVPDVRSPAFRVAAHRQSLAVARSARARIRPSSTPCPSGMTRETRRSADGIRRK